MKATAGEYRNSYKILKSWRLRGQKSDNLDDELAKYMKKYFLKEVREKQRQNELERGIEDYGPGYEAKQCIVM